jgi:hypothetical protein
MLYPTALKTARMQAVVTYLNSGFLDLMAGASIAVSVPLDATSGTVSNDTLTFSSFPKSVTSAGAYTITSAQLRPVSGSVITGLTVGLPGSGAQVIIDNGVASLALVATQVVTVAGSPGPRLVHAA